MSTSRQTMDSSTIRVAFDTSVLIDWHKKPPNKTTELESLSDIFEVKISTKTTRWHFIYLDAVRREIGGAHLDKLERESEIEDILQCFDERVSLSKLPFTLPVTIVGRAHGEAVTMFQSIGVSKSDSVVLADAVYLKAQYLVTTDMRIIRNVHCVRQAQSHFNLKIKSPTEFRTLIARPSSPEPEIPPEAARSACPLPGGVMMP
jgi:predicted nucleic acid-binding protein